VIERMHSFLRESAANGREVVAVPPFTAFFHRTDSLRFFNYAVPDGDVLPTPAEVGRLRAAFCERDRVPRLEWIEEFAPRLAAELERAGMREELRTPLMACQPKWLIEASADLPDLSVRAMTDGDLREATELQRQAFGDPPLGADENPSDPRARGGGGVIARSGSEAVAGGGWTRVIDGVSELVGISTAELWRRRGLAGAVTAALARDAFAAGAELCVLTPGDEGALRVYERAGFRPIATVLNYSDEFA
jgi:ribosomal protein S18 acetylase RimI-like enzyme